MEGYTPVLGRTPDAVRAPAPLFPAYALVYVALMAGSAAAGIAALYNAVLLRRARLAAAAIVLSAAGWLGFGAAVQAAVSVGVKNVGLWLVCGRLASILVGSLLCWSQVAHVRGHQFLEGRVVPLLPVVLAMVGLVLVVPFRALLVMEGLWQLL